mgnify:CR=1 FL=1
MANFYRDNKDLRFYVNKWIDWRSLFELTERFGDAREALETQADAVQFYTDILDLVGEFVADEIAPHSGEIDRQGVEFENGEPSFPARLESIFEQLRDLELYGMNLPRELKGQNCPMMLYMIQTELFTRADTSVTTHFSFHGGIAMALLLFSIREGSTTFDPNNGEILSTRFAEAIEEIRLGKEWGSMDITEPDAGSDMAKLRCYGEQDKDGHWFVTGQKIFITSGHGKYHFVIARTEETTDLSDPMAGLKGLSFFLVPGYSDSDTGVRTRHVKVDRIEEKMGHHGSPTCAVTFERSPALLIGQRGEGFKYMLTLMNNARVGVGFECIGLSEAAYRVAQTYASERPSMGKTIDQHEMIADYLEEIDVEIKGVRALAMEAAVQEELAARTEQLVDSGLAAGTYADNPTAQKHVQSLRRRKHLGRRYTPLLKYIAAENAVKHSRMAVQILGGVGYTKEYPAEQLLRDAVVMPIYEGTSQIQALMAMKDTLGGIIKNPQRFLKKRAQLQWRAVSSTDPLGRRVAKLQNVSLATQQFLVTKIAKGKFASIKDQPVSDWPTQFLKNWDPKKDFSYAMLHAERLIQILTDEAICELLYRQAQSHPERRPILEAYLERAEPRCRFLFDTITTTGERLLAKLDHTQEAGETGQAAS